MMGAQVYCQLWFSEGQTSGRVENCHQTIGALLIIIKSLP